MNSINYVGTLVQLHASLLGIAASGEMCTVLHYSNLIYWWAYVTGTVILFQLSLVI